MKTLKKSFSVFLAVLMMLSVCGAGFAASAKEPTLIDRVDISLDTDIAGKSFYDYKDFYTIETEHVDYDYDYTGESSFYFQIDGSNYYDAVMPGETYEFDFYFVADEGYYFDDDTEIYLNGDLVTNNAKMRVINYYEDGKCSLMFKIDQTVDGEPIVYEVIDRVDITLDTDIAGKSYLDYADIYTIDTEHVTYDDSIEGYYGLYFADGDAGYDGSLKAGKMYTFDFYLAAEEGYRFDENTEIYINGALIEPDYFGTYYDSESGLFTLNFETSRVIDGGFLAKLITAITEFFAKIVSFFKNIFNKPTPEIFN